MFALFFFTRLQKIIPQQYFQVFLYFVPKKMVPVVKGYTRTLERDLRFLCFEVHFSLVDPVCFFLVLRYVGH